VGAIPWGFKSPLSHHISSEVPQTCATHPGSSPADKASVMKVSRMVFPLPSVGFSDCRIFGGRFGGQFFGFNERYRSQKKRRSCRPHRASILESSAGSDGKFLRKRTPGWAGENEVLRPDRVRRPTKALEGSEDFGSVRTIHFAGQSWAPPRARRGAACGHASELPSGGESRAIQNESRQFPKSASRCETTRCRSPDTTQEHFQGISRPHPALVDLR
jgi:hypothetical protein